MVFGPTTQSSPISVLPCRDSVRPDHRILTDLSRLAQCRCVAGSIRVTPPASRCWLIRSRRTASASARWTRVLMPIPSRHLPALEPAPTSPSELAISDHIGQVVFTFRRERDPVQGIPQPVGCETIHADVQLMDCQLLRSCLSFFDNVLTQPCSSRTIRPKPRGSSANIVSIVTGPGWFFCAWTICSMVCAVNKGISP